MSIKREREGGECQLQEIQAVEEDDLRHLHFASVRFAKGICDFESREC